ncbi:HipA domain-containing protein [Roseobacter sp. HKCCA0434]|uniref:HipA domain-containing protein n=1 Tax=Roseobacter sp. HKCCA0434 TaxID=3079297 RepID=UPI002905B67D|nr:HipA domain-containing protein [Roseobacter sp. HKCCA0434]
MTVLDVYLEAMAGPVGRLSSDADGAVSFAYVTDALPHPLSLALPVREEPYDDVAARGFFSNLLFENEMRDQVMQRHGIAERDVVGLLYHLGADCPGAISCVPEGQGPAKQPGVLDTDYEALGGGLRVPDTLAQDILLPVDDALERIMVALRDHRRVPRDLDDPSPLAGVQGKIALTRLEDGRLALPQPGSGAPTTHILKVPRTGQMHTVLREHLATGLMGRVQDHPVARTCVVGQGALQGLLIERFDRRVADGAVHRIHQEDFCQALGLGERLKYERHGLPGRAFTAAAMGALVDRTRLPGRTRQALFEITVANMMLGNSDNHAKNHALLYTGAAPELAPAYDIDPVLLDDVTHEMAFCVGSARIADDVTEEDLGDLLRNLGGRGLTKQLLRRVAEIGAQLLGAAADLPSPDAKPLYDVIGQQVHHLSENLGLGLDVPEFDNVPVNRP